MSNDMIQIPQGDMTVVSSKYAAIADDLGDDLSGGVSGSYAIVSIKGGRFSLKYKGDMTPITNPENGDPVGSLELVLVKSNPFLTKQYYVKGFVEGDSAAPDCFSIDGKVPSAQSPLPQHANCATCPQNTFSKINESTGKKTKPCQDNRKMAILPASDLKNEMFGGPMLMRIPAASLGDLATFGSTMKQRGYPYNAVVVRVSFDLTVSYPKLVFKAVRVLNDEEADQVIEWYNSDVVDKMLADFSDIKAPAEQPAADPDFEQPPQKAAAPIPAPAPKPVPVPKPVPQAPKAPPPQPAAAPKPAGVSFGAAPKSAAQAAPAAPKAPAQKPKATPKPAAQAPAAPAAQASLPLPEEAQAAPGGDDVDTTTEQVAGNLEGDIESILNELSSIAS